MRLEPIEFGRRDSADVQTVDVGRVGQLALPLPVVRDCGPYERWADLLNHLLLRTLNHCDIREHIFGVRNLRVGRLALNHPWAEISAAFFLDQSRTKLRRHVFGSLSLILSWIEV